MTNKDQQAKPKWRLFPHFGFRCTGFPFEILESLRMSDTTTLIRQILDFESSIEILQTQLVKEYLPQAVRSERLGNRRKSVLKILSFVRSRMKGYRFPDSNAISDLKSADLTDLAARLADLGAMVKQRKELFDRGRKSFGREFKLTEQKLFEQISNQRFQEALFISNPNMIHNAVPTYRKVFNLQKRSAKQRKLEKKFITYLQRFCAKNDTAAFFGPMNTGRFEPETDAYLKICMPNKRTDSNRMVFVSFWAVQALADAIGKDAKVRNHLKPGLNPVCQVDDRGEVYFHFIDKAVNLNDTFLSVLRAANGKQSVLSIAGIVGMDMEVLTKILTKLEKAHILIWRIMIPSTIYHPLEFLIQQVKDLPSDCTGRDKWLTLLQNMDRLRDEYRQANLDERKVLLARMEELFENTTGVKPTRAEGDTYADRSIIYEECGGDIESLVLGKHFMEDFQRRLETCLRLCQAHGQYLWEHYQQIGKQIIANWKKDSGEIPYSGFVNTLKQLQEESLIEPTGNSTQSFNKKLNSLIELKTNGRICKLTSQDVASITGTGDFQRKHYHVSPDVLICAKSLEDLQSGRYKIIMGEFHAFMMPWGSQLYFYPQRQEAERKLAAAIDKMSEYSQLSILLNVRRHKGLIFDSFPGTFLELFAKSSKDGENGALPISRVNVHFEDGEFKLGELDSQTRFKIYTGGDEKLNLWIFAPPPILQPPISLGRHTPRVEVEGVVFQREHWEIPYDELIPSELYTNSFELFMEIWRRKTQHQLPDMVFVKSTGEKKPYFIDFANFLLTEVLCDLPRGEGKLEIAEMLPDSENLWLRDEQGRYCSELRILNLHY